MIISYYIKSLLGLQNGRNLENEQKGWSTNTRVRAMRGLSQDYVADDLSIPLIQ